MLTGIVWTRTRLNISYLCVHVKFFQFSKRLDTNMFEKKLLNESHWPIHWLSIFKTAKHYVLCFLRSIRIRAIVYTYGLHTLQTTCSISWRINRKKKTAFWINLFLFHLVFHYTSSVMLLYVALHAYYILA